MLGQNKLENSTFSDSLNPVVITVFDIQLWNSPGMLNGTRWYFSLQDDLTYTNVLKDSANDKIDKYFILLFYFKLKQLLF